MLADATSTRQRRKLFSRTNPHQLRNPPLQVSARYRELRAERGVRVSLNLRRHLVVSTKLDASQPSCPRKGPEITDTPATCLCVCWS